MLSQAVLPDNASYHVTRPVRYHCPGPSSLRSGRERNQNSGSQSAAGPGRPWRGGREGAPAWSAAWTAAATSCAVSASTTMFRRSRTRRTTCPACGDASRGPRVAGEGPLASGLVTPGTVKETVPARLPDTRDLQRLLQRSPAVPARSGAPRRCGGPRPASGLKQYALTRRQSPRSLHDSASLRCVSSRRADSRSRPEPARIGRDCYALVHLEAPRAQLRRRPPLGGPSQPHTRSFRPVLRRPNQSGSRTEGQRPWPH